MKKSIIIYFICYIFSLNADIEMLVLNVGQGNCIAVRNSSTRNAIIADCGRSFVEEFSEEQLRPFLNFIANCNVNIFITHAHYDHFSLLTDILNAQQNYNIIIQNIYCSDFGKDSKFLQESNLWGANNQYISVQSSADVNNINNLLGENISIEAMIPSSWPVTRSGRRSTNPNDNSLVLLINDRINKKKILLTGDATGILLDCIQQDADSTEKMKDIDCIVVPHHGSNLSGEFNWINFIKDNVSTDKKDPLLILISSNPETANNLPWFGISKICLFRDEPFQGYKTVSHSISVRNNIINNIESPIFVTKNASAGFFSLISENRKLKLFNGEKNPDSLLFSSGKKTFFRKILRFFKYAFKNFIEIFKPV